MNADIDHPVIDFQPFIHGTAEERAAVASAIDNALRFSTYFYLKGHGIDASKISEAFTRSKEFFQLSQAEKNALPEYQRPGTEVIRSELSMKEVFKFNNPGGLSSDDWPSDERLPGFHNFFDGFWRDCSNLLDQLLNCLSDALRLDSQDRFLNFHTTSRYRMNLHHYPAIGTPEECHNRMGVHSDTTSLSILFQDETGGLEVGERNSVAGKCSARTFNQLNGKFKAVKPIDGTVLVFVGYMIGQWTNLRWKSTIHRVTMPTPENKQSLLLPERFSITFFATPDSGTIIEPLPGTWNDDNPKLRHKFEVDSYLLGKTMDTALPEALLQKHEDFVQQILEAIAE